MYRTSVDAWFFNVIVGHKKHGDYILDGVPMDLASKADGLRCLLKWFAASEVAVYV